MATSNWQHIPYCVELFRKFEPKSILDIGVGFGRWGILAREFLDVWYGRSTPEQWKLRVDGIEAFEPLISDYHYTFYNRIHIGDAFDVLPKMGEFDLVILGDVLEHFSPDRAMLVLQRCKIIGKLVLLAIPLGEDWHQDETDGNPYERHLSFWTEDQLTTPDLCQKKIFQDFSERPFGVFLYHGSSRPPKMAKSKDATKLRKEPGFAAKELYGYLSRHPRRTKLLYNLLKILHKWSP
jgi:SAM-dependent methyltransferase